MNAQTADYWLNKGTLAYFDSLYNGLIAIRISAFENTPEGPRVHARVTSRKHSNYPCGSRLELGLLRVVPRPAVYRSRQRCGQYMIRPYRWVQP